MLDCSFLNYFFSNLGNDTHLLSSLWWDFEEIRVLKAKSNASIYSRGGILMHIAMLVNRIYHNKQILPDPLVIGKNSNLNASKCVWRIPIFD